MRCFNTLIKNPCRNHIKQALKPPDTQGKIERGKPETDLHTAEVRFKTLLEITEDAVVLTGQHGEIILANLQAESMFGYSAGSLPGQQIETLIPFTESQPQYKDIFGQNPLSPSPQYQLRLTAKRQGGTEFPCDVALNVISSRESNTILCRITDISGRLETEQLKISLRNEQESSASLKKAVSTFSHDVRSSLAVISISKNVLLHSSEQMDDKKRHDRLDAIDRKLEYVVFLLNDLAMIAKGRVDEGKSGRMNLPALCQMCLSEIQITTGSNHKFYFVSDAQITTVELNEILVSRILLNLLSNAVKYSPEGGEVRLELGQRENRAVLRVIDQGIGISEADQQYIFDPFYRSDSVQNIEGSGLGLNIVQDCVRRLHGEIRVESQLDKGTTMIVELPLVKT